MGGARAAAVVVAALVVLAALAAAAVVLAGYVRLAAHASKFEDLRFPRASLAAELPALQSGDLLLFVAAAGPQGQSLGTRTFFSHAGVVVREGGAPFVGETTAALELAPGQWVPAGARLTPLVERLCHYVGLVCLLRLDPPLDNAGAAAITRAARRCLRGEPGALPYPSPAGFLRGMAGWPPRARHCFQHVALLLGAAGLVPAELGPAGFEGAGFLGVGAAVCEIAGKPLRPAAGGRRYLPPVLLVCDVGLGRAKPPRLT